MGGGAAALTSIACATSSDAAQALPNVVIIYGDDVGFGDVGAYGSKMIPTPNIDKLASEGLRFTDAHCAASTCTPSRFSLLTGTWAFRRNGTGILSGNAPMPITPKDFTLPKLFKGKGYATAAIGKWHLGLGSQKNPVDWNGEIKPSPLDIGFDYCFLVPATNDRVPCAFLENRRIFNLDPKDPITVSYRKPVPKNVPGTEYPDAKKNPEPMTFYKSTRGHNNSVINGIGRIGYMKGGKSAIWQDDKMSEVFVEHAKKFISDNKDHPFFLYFASQCIHVPRVPAKRFRGKTELGYRGDSMVEFDWVTGEILKTLDEYGLKGNTIVIFSSDNGPVWDDGYADGSGKSKEHKAAGPFRGGKYTMYEGGTRVPFIIRWPGEIKPGVSSALISQVDLIASFAALLGAKLEPDQAPDSRNVLPALLGKTQEGDPFILEQNNGRVVGIRIGQWKFVPSTGKGGWQGVKKSMLYNLAEDIGERNNLFDQKPEKAKEMNGFLEKIIKAGRTRHE